MQLKNLQIAAGLGAAIAFLLAFMAAGAMVASLLFALVGALLIAWIVYGLARTMLDRRLSHGRHPAVRPPAG
jgi:ABC-type Fe3+-siderophore transport system permease subunit